MIKMNIVLGVILLVENIDLIYLFKRLVFLIFVIDFVLICVLFFVGLWDFIKEYGGYN